MTNEEQYLEMIKSVDPDLYMIKIALLESNVNPEIIPSIIRVIGNLSIGTGYGKIQIFMEARVITSLKPEETVTIKKNATVEK